MDEARAAGLKLAVCSAATKSSVVFTLKSLLGEGRFQGLDCFLAGERGEREESRSAVGCGDVGAAGLRGGAQAWWW